MKWLELAATDFDEALKMSEGVVLIPIGSIEIHGPHLPVGCDTFLVERLMDIVEEQEEIIGSVCLDPGKGMGVDLFRVYPLGQARGSRNWVDVVSVPGCVERLHVV